VLVAVVVLATAASLSLSGCFALPNLVGGGNGGSTGGGTSGGSSGGGQSGQSGGDQSGTTTTPPDSDQLGELAGLPTDFPTAEIPLVDGPVVLGINLGTGWTVIVSVDDLAAGYRDASQRLESAGYSVLAESESSTGSFGAFENDTYQVQVTASDAPDYGLTVTYIAILRG
jgi:hypothetical protein